MRTHKQAVSEGRPTLPAWRSSAMERSDASSCRAFKAAVRVHTTSVRFGRSVHRVFISGRWEATRFLQLGLCELGRRNVPQSRFTIPSAGTQGTDRSRHATRATFESNEWSKTAMHKPLTILSTPSPRRSSWCCARRSLAIVQRQMERCTSVLPPARAQSDLTLDAPFRTLCAP